MKSILPLPEKAAKAMQKEIRRQCVAQSEIYEIESDTVWIYAIREVSKRKKRPIGKKLMLEIYQAMFEAREKMKEWYQADDGDGIVETAMRFELRHEGIDVEEMYRNEESNKLRVLK